jgi:hypothetical protein
VFCGYFGGLERCVYTKLSDRLEHLTYDIIMEVVDAPQRSIHYESTRYNVLFIMCSVICAAFCLSRLDHSPSPP